MLSKERQDDRDGETRPAEVSPTINFAPAVCNCSAMSTAYGPPIVRGTIPQTRPSSLGTRMAVWKQARMPTERTGPLRQVIREVAVEVQDAQWRDGFLRKATLGAYGIHQTLGRERGPRAQGVLQKRQGRFFSHGLVATRR